MQWIDQAPQGWQCPWCKTVYSPTVTACACPAQMKIGTTTTSSTDIEDTPQEDAPGDDD